MSYTFSNPFRYKIQVWESPLKSTVPGNTEELKKLFGKNKVVPKHLEELFYEMISYYPELKDSYIIVVEKKFYGIQHTLRAYPPMLSLLNKRETRVSPIVINTNKNVPISFYSLSTDQQKGVLAHELAHIADYTRRTSLELIGLSYMFCFSKDFVRKLESNTDKITIDRGAGNYLSEFRKYVSEKTTKKSYQKYEKIIYQNEPVTGWRSLRFSVIYSIKTAFSFLIAVEEMMVLVYIKKIHKKPSNLDL